MWILNRELVDLEVKSGSFVGNLDKDIKYKKTSLTCCHWSHRNSVFISPDCTSLVCLPSEIRDHYTSD